MSVFLQNTNKYNVHLHRNPETLTTFFGSGTKRLLPSWLLVFRHEERETHTIFTMLTVPTSSFSQLPSWTLGPESKSQLTDPTHPVTHKLDSPRFETRLAQRQISTDCFFQKSPKFPAHRFRVWRHLHPSLISYLGFLLWLWLLLWLSHPPRASVNACINSRTVLSLTKPNDKI